ncbi:hypothetical protein MMU07_13615 [Aquiflexum sp. LQ15W]|uniref:hypothetical protein n=1 Tax=Cognataquiflexum nitidum TaxID=2922272 RepID=UPI001F133F6A|nr:hypothetical protein [Cognataquiflexum nitidum]MCH6200619.1 hypothetical protein [Cognataquiflexum nitidum]
MKNYSYLLIILSAFVLTFSSCKSDDPVPENEGEVITDVILKFTELNSAGSPTGTPIEVKAIDPDGLELGNSPTIETITLGRGKTYLLEISLFNSIENEDITEEIEEEKEEHQFFFLGSAFQGTAILTYSYDDEDIDGNPVGLRGIVQTIGFNTAQMRVVLRHDLNKNFTGANNPNWENFVQAGGESDLDITFPVVLN